MHAILDNYGTHKHPKVMAWLGRHPRWVFHFTPTSASWTNAVESFFSVLTRRRFFEKVADFENHPLYGSVHETDSDTGSVVVGVGTEDRVPDKRLGVNAPARRDPMAKLRFERR